MWLLEATILALVIALPRTIYQLRGLLREADERKLLDSTHRHWRERHQTYLMLELARCRGRKPDPPSRPTEEPDGDPSNDASP